MASQEQDQPVRRRTGAIAARRREREEEILAATRELFDAAGVRDAQIEDIANAVGINRAIIYRHFSGKEELFALTLVGYLEEITAAMQSADDPQASPSERLASVSGAFLDYGQRYPAFGDCALALLRRPGDELLLDVSEAAMMRLGQGMVGAIGSLVTVLEAGQATGEFAQRDPYLLANVLYAQALGALQLGRNQIAVSGDDEGSPEIHRVSFDQVRTYLVEAALVMATGPRPA
ncbi:TetR/AcrR family transcriptional regulator [Solicola sp. PLA-1-18]|uniref:TetR/AcrR family transcriptional regulator n=1 Tax=Solicola sp. PLA-1-18 TaxID=3380532 RepID=UPI003B7CBC7B